MFWYILLFKYGNEWHMDCFHRDEPYDKAVETDRLWLAEAVCFLVERFNLRKDGFNVVREASLFPLLLQHRHDDNSHIELMSIPIDAIDEIKLQSHADPIHPE